MAGAMQFDVVEVVEDRPEDGLRVGQRGTIVEQHSDHVFEIEFADERGETTGLMALPESAFVIVWRAESGKWVGPDEQLRQVVARLPEEAQAEVLDFALFLRRRRLPDRRPAPALE